MDLAHQQLHSVCLLKIHSLKSSNFFSKGHPNFIWSSKLIVRGSLDFYWSRLFIGRHLSRPTRPIYPILCPTSADQALKHWSVVISHQKLIAGIIFNRFTYLHRPTFIHPTRPIYPILYKIFYMVNLIVVNIGIIIDPITESCVESSCKTKSLIAFHCVAASINASGLSQWIVWSRLTNTYQRKEIPI